jgi:hypothetical protein
MASAKFIIILAAACMRASVWLNIPQLHHETFTPAHVTGFSHSNKGRMAAERKRS